MFSTIHKYLRIRHFKYHVRNLLILNFFQFLYNDSDVFPTLYSPYVQSPSFDIEILAFYKNSTSTIKTNSFPLWYKNLTRLSLARAAENQQTCAELGGYITDSYFCETLYKVSQVCIQVFKIKRKTNKKDRI